MAQSWPPKKNTALTLIIEIRNSSTGALITGATGLDSEVSIDGAAFSDCTNEATEIGTTGIYTLALTASEMNGDIIIVQTKSSSANAITCVRVIYTTPGTWTDGINVSSMSNNVITSNAIATDAIDADAIKADAGTEIGAAVLAALQAITNSGTAAAGASSSITLAAGASASDSFYVNAIVLITTGTGAGQYRRISAYVGATKVATVSPNWATAPDNTSTYVVVAL